jgi:hypothetical protein
MNATGPTGNRAPLTTRLACGSRNVSLWLFAKRAEAAAWADESGPGF